jgi:hypothetical protein
VNSHFGVRRLEEAEEFASELENNKVTSGALVVRWSQTPLTIFVVSGIGEPRAWHQDSRNREERNFEKEESSIVGPVLENVSEFDISTFREIGGRDICSKDSKNHET